MAKPCNRFAALVLGYLEETKMTPPEFSEYLRDWRAGGVSVNTILGGAETMAMILSMIYSTRHRLKKELQDPEFNSMAFFLEYQLNRPIDETSADSIFAGLFQGLPKELYRELAESSMDLSVMFVPERSPWTQPAMFGPAKVELSHQPVRKSKPLPTPTHKAPSTLQ